MILKLMLVTGLIFGMASPVLAQSDESEEGRVAAEKAKRRRYPGGHDEQELTVRAVLPVPSRYPQDPKADAGPKGKEPAQEEMHD